MNVLLLGLGVLLTLGTTLFVAAEFSLVSLDRHAVERAVEAGDRRAVGVLASVRTLSTQLSGAQVGITLTTLVVGYLTEPALSALLTTPLRRAGVSAGVLDPVSAGLALAVVTVFSMIVGELLPQNLGISAPLATARVVAGPVRAFSAVIRPLIVLLAGSANRLLGAVGVTTQEELSGARTPEELAALVRRSAEAGTLDQGTAAILTRSLGFSARTASDVMTPRVRMLVVARTETAADVIRASRRSGHSRFPVVEDGVDDVVGVVHLKTAVAVPRERREEVPVSALMSTILRVPETVRLDPLLVTLRRPGLQLALVQDEYGGTAGVVTLEDVIEEIVGDVADEHDRTRLGMVRRRDGSWSVPGLARTDEVRSRTGLAVPDAAQYDTVGGYLMAALGRVPAVGDEVALAGAVARVERMDGRRVDRVRLVPTVPTAGDLGGRDGPVGGPDEAGVSAPVGRP